MIHIFCFQKDDAESVEEEFVKEAEKEIDGHDDSKDGHDLEDNDIDGHDVDGHDDIDGHDKRKRRDVHSVEEDNDQSEVI